MKSGFIPIFIASLFCFSVQAEPEEKASPEQMGPGMLINNTNPIAKDQIADLELKALDGDKLAAMRLYQYYIVDVEDYQKGRYWLQIAAENGDPGAELNLVSLMTSDLPQRDPESRRQDSERACFWARKASTEGLLKDHSYAWIHQRCKIGE